MCLLTNLILSGMYLVLSGVETKKIKLMKTIKKLTATVLAVLFTATLTAQDNAKVPDLAINSTNYKTAIGLRAGETSGLTIKQFIGSSTALEGIVGVWSHGLSATLLYEKHVPAFDVDGLNWYYGAGGHVAFESGRRILYYRNDRYYRYNDGNIGLGVDGIIGLEYKIPTIPFALSLDVKPYVEVITNGRVWTSLDPGLGIKVTF